MTTPDRTLVGVAAALSAGAGLVHVGVASEHVEHHWSMGAAFLLLGWAQLGTAGLLWWRRSRAALLPLAVVQLAAVAGLAWSARQGWPVGPLAGQPEAVTTAALLCLGLQLAAVGCCASASLGRVRLPRAVLPVGLAAAVACSSAALALGPEHSSTATADHHGAATGVAAGGAAPHVEDDTHPADTRPAAAGAAVAGAGHGHGPVDTTPPTDAQRAAADDLLAASRATMDKYAVASVAEAEGYRVVHDAGGKLLHYAHPGYAADGEALDPERIESLLYVVLPGGGKLLVGGMYMVPKGERGPAVGGSLTQWHAHDDLCLDPVQGIAITQLAGGGCPPGSAVGATGEMMHVWDIDYAGGPFGELDAEQLRTSVLDHFGIAPTA